MAVRPAHGVLTCDMLSRRASGHRAVWFVGLCLMPLACGGQCEAQGNATANPDATPSAAPAASIPPNASGSQAGQAGSSTLPGAPELGAAEGVSPEGCSEAENHGPLPAATDCEVLRLDVDPALTCGGESCPFSAALDVVCPTYGLENEGSLVVTGDGVSVALHSGYGGSATRRLVVSEGSATVQEIPLLSQEALSAGSRSGAQWLAGCVQSEVLISRGSEEVLSTQSEIVVARESEGAWRALRIPTPFSRTPLLGLAAVDDDAGYLLYSMLALPTPVRLVSWQGTCWTDEDLTTETPNLFGVDPNPTLRLDANERPWIAWDTSAGSQRTLHLRAPSGQVQTVASYDGEGTWPPPLPPRVLPGGKGGTTELPAIAVRGVQGILLFAPTADSIWLSSTLPGSAPGETTGNCPPDDTQFVLQPCAGLTTCSEQVQRTSRGFGLARTESGEAFAAWVRYSSEADYALTEDVVGGEMGISYCNREEIRATGTSTLVLARLADAEPILTEFDFELTHGVYSTDYEVALAARGETLVVLAPLDGGRPPGMRYLEIDSR